MGKKSAFKHIRETMPVNSSISRSKILENIRDALDQAESGMSHRSYESVGYGLKYLGQAEILIELLEVDDCGSVGGFDTKRGQNRDKMRTLKDRFEWLSKIS